MAKIRFTKNELKKQKDDLKRFLRYLPTLILKKQQLQLEIIKIQKKLEACLEETENLKKDIYQWTDVFAEGIDVGKLVTVVRVVTSSGNIAGTDIPVLEGIDFKEEEYDLMTTPLWVDYGVTAVKKGISLRVELDILQKQMDAVKEELRITTQRVNLFEKVKIPEAKENIRRIQIYLGDLQTAAVAIGKIAKEKIERKQELAVV